MRWLVKESRMVPKLKKNIWQIEGPFLQPLEKTNYTIKFKAGRCCFQLYGNHGLNFGD